MAINLEYIGWRPNHRDRYAKLTWPATGCVQPVPAHQAQKMLARHPDVYRLAQGETADTLAEALELAVPESNLEEMLDIEAHALRIEVARMDKAQLVKFAQAKFGTKLDGRLSAESMAREVVQLIDLYGVP